MFNDGGYDGKEKGTCHSLQTFSLGALDPDMISSADLLDLMVQHDLWYMIKCFFEKNKEHGKIDRM